MEFKCYYTTYWQVSQVCNMSEYIITVELATFLPVLLH